jgi:hypothetical protein
VEDYDDFIDEEHYQNSPQQPIDIQDLDSSVRQEISTFFSDNEEDFLDEVKEPKIITKPRPVTKEERRDYRNRTIQCFFCDEKVDGRKNFKSHMCKVKTRPCIVEGCNKVFKNQGSFNVHITTVQ